MFRTNTPSYRVPAAVLLAGVFIVLALGGYLSQHGGGGENVNRALAANKAITSSVMELPPLKPTVISIESLRKLLGVRSDVDEETLVNWLRYSTRSHAANALVEDELPPSLIRFAKYTPIPPPPPPPPPSSSAMPDFSDHEVSNIYNCVSNKFPSTLYTLNAQMVGVVYSGQSAFQAPNNCCDVDCNASNTSTYVPYVLSPYQVVKWGSTSNSVRNNFMMALNSFANAAQVVGTQQILCIKNLGHGSTSASPYTSATYSTCTLTSTLGPVTLHVLQLSP